MHRIDDDIIGDDHRSRSSPLFWEEDHYQKLKQAHRAPRFVLILRPDVRHRHIKNKKLMSDYSSLQWKVRKPKILIYDLERLSRLCHIRNISNEVFRKFQRQWRCGTCIQWNIIQPLKGMN